MKHVSGDPNDRIDAAEASFDEPAVALSEAAAARWVI